ncbi:MAG: hypothetical protein ACRECD_01130 [Burkholderiaceae bacterium]
MAHAQQQILDALAALLSSGGTVAGTRVFVDRVDPLQANELPAILIEEDQEGESAEPYTIHGVEQRELSVLVSGVLSHSTTAAADARALGLAMEKLIAPSTALAALAKLGVRITHSRLVITGELDRLLAARQQSWRFTYLVNAATPDVIF